MRRAAPEVAKDLKGSLRRAGEIVAADARSRAGFSSRIPGTVKVRVSGPSVSVVAGGSGAPGAAPLENRGRSGTFRHPVFGNRDVWVAQEAHPFLVPAADAQMGRIVAAVEQAVDDALRRI